MSTKTDTDTERRLAVVRASEVGRTLTELQLKEATAMAGIIDDRIKATGAFRDMLTDLSVAFARTQKFEPLAGETIIRGVYEASYGQTMNHRRKQLQEREETVRDEFGETALASAKKVLEVIATSDDMPYYRALDQVSVKLADTLDITQAGAKRMMAEAHRRAEGGDLYDAGKALEKQHYKPRERVASRDAAPRRSRTVDA